MTGEERPDGQPALQSSREAAAEHVELLICTEGRGNAQVTEMYPRHSEIPFL